MITISMENGMIINHLRQKGCRITKARRAIIEQLERSKAISADQLYTQLVSMEQKVDKATVYRELKMLVEFKVAQLVTVGGNTNFYELSGHHHHLVCQKCQTVICLGESKVELALSAFEQLVARLYKVTVTGHELYLTGYCQHCQKENK